MRSAERGSSANLMPNFSRMMSAYALSPIAAMRPTISMRKMTTTVPSSTAQTRLKPNFEPLRALLERGGVLAQAGAGELRSHVAAAQAIDDKSGRRNVRLRLVDDLVELLAAANAGEHRRAQRDREQQYGGDVSLWSDHERTRSCAAPGSAASNR